MSASTLVTQCVYGPVPSRRLGRSLGVDVVPLKTCTYDCIYCQLGRTTRKTVRRRRWIEPARVVEGVREKLGSAPDMIALAGSGEPTLYNGIGEVIAGVKDVTDIPVAVITNGSLLGVPAVQRDLRDADLVLPSLDVADAGLFALVNRPQATLRFDQVVDGMTAFRKRYTGQIWLEVMLLGGVTAIAAEAERIAAVAARIAPDRIQLNTTVRPPAEAFVHAVAPERLTEFAALFTPLAEVIAETAAGPAAGDATDDDVLALLRRRPCSVADIATGLAVHHAVALKAATSLVAAGRVEERQHGGQTFYAAAASQKDQEEQT
jgi:wyosine [tRNA(Phe)-imidazoG37] synthetase (radical SAM superfamily)